ncbi:zinc transport [Fusarium pseudocircinatum]|uniref:Zinc transport n=1 Tax=Fusarium pseudocircinatum TaxID=56676 RepID=A0A8H5UZ11_9HYPO|nr:zinc transport [Fusarium pseudocircinatum]
MAGPSYADFVRLRRHNNPCLWALSQHLSHPACSESRIAFIDIPHAASSTPAPQPHFAKAKDCAGLTRVVPDDITRLLVIEDISSDLIIEIGEALDIDPLFFAEYIITDFQNLETQPPPPSLAILPSLMSKKPHIHLHYQQVLHLTSTDKFESCSYALKTNCNIPRNVRRLAPLAERQLALARASCSTFFKSIGSSSIGLILVDRPITYVFDALGTRRERAYPAKVMFSGFEDFEPSSSFTTFTSGETMITWDKASMFDSIMHYFCMQPPPGFSASSVEILAIAYYPIRIVLAEWNLYVHLTSRFSKHYEYSLREIGGRLHDDDIVDLQRWRRRTKQSRYKLALLDNYIDHRLGHRNDKEHWMMVRKDIEYLQQQLQDYGQSLEQMITVATSMVQLMNSRRSILEAVSVRRLTYIALIFIPLAWVSSLFSMSDGFLPGEKHFWIYFATSLPLLGLVVLLSALPYERLLRTLGISWQRLRE